MHSSGERSAEDYTGSAVVIKPFELGAALLAARRDFAHANLVADHLHRLSALCHTPVKRRKRVLIITVQNVLGTVCRNYNKKSHLLRKFSIHSADVFFEHLSITDLLFHISSLFGVAAEHEKAGSEPIQSMNSA